jgi:pyridoxine 4-dehydrogenase
LLECCTRISRVVRPSTSAKVSVFTASASGMPSKTSVQNRFNFGEQEADDVLRACEAEGIGFIPFAPIAMGGLAVGSPHSPRPPPGIGRRPPRSRSPGCCGARRPYCPIPGTGSLEHLRENVDAALLDLSESEI